MKRRKRMMKKKAKKIKNKIKYFTLRNLFFFIGKYLDLINLSIIIKYLIKFNYLIRFFLFDFY